MTGPLAGLLEQGWLAELDRRMDAFLEPWRGRTIADRVAVSASKLGDWSLIWHVIGGLRGLRSERSAAQALQFSALIGLESLVVNQGVKRLFRRDRPMPAGDRRYGLRTPTTSSFPSGHASAAFFAARLLTRRSPRLAPAWYAIALVLAISRPYVRIHHASDVISGAVVGAALAELAIATTE